MSGNDDLQADLVLEGGGVKGTALVGAIEAFADAGYHFCRVAGTSAGAIVGALTAAGMEPRRMREVMESLDYRRFTDAGWLARLPFVGPVGAIVAHDGIYRGDELVEWLSELLGECGVTTFADLAETDPESALPADKRYRLVVTTADISRNRLVYLPYDYRDHFGLDPDQQRVADAVRASMSIPFFFRPVRLAHADEGGASTLVDGGVLSNFPVAVFDRTDGRPPRWPTFGIKLSERTPAGVPAVPVRGPLRLTAALFATMMNAHDARHLDDPAVVERTVFVDTSGVSSIDFDLSAEDAERLRANGERAAVEFLESWSHARYLASHRPRVGRAAARRP